MEEPDFVAKYGALLHILEHGQEDLEALAGEQGYSDETSRQWRDTHCDAVLGYMRAIRTDFEILWQQTSGKATLAITARALDLRRRDAPDFFSHLPTA